MENINLSTTDDRHTTTILSAIPVPPVIIGNWQTTLHRHRQPSVSVIGIDQLPSQDLAAFCSLVINSHRQLR